jgi:hypothetical protein
MKWLSEPERCDRCVELEKQRGRAVEREKKLEVTEAKRRLERSRESPPELVESDVKSDDDGSVSSVSDFAPGRDGRDYWKKEEVELPAPAPPDVAAKSPIIRPSESPPTAPTFQPTPPQLPPEEASEEADSSSLGRSADGKSR